MTKQTINIGSAPNDSTGDPLRTAFTKINNNFDDLYSNGAGGSNFRLQINTMSTTQGDINLAPIGANSVVIGDGNQLLVSNTQVSIDETTGAFVVNGGAGIGGDLNIGGALYAPAAGFDALDGTPIGNVQPSTGKFTNLTASFSTVTNTLIVSTANINQINSPTIQGTIINANAYYGSLAVFDNSYTSTGTVVNLTSSNANITGGNISGVSVAINAINNTPIGNTTPNTAVFTKMTTSNAQITGGSITGVSITPSAINGAPIGNSTPSSGVFTNISVTNSTASTSTSTGALIVTGGVGVGANLTANIVSAVANGFGTNFKVGDDAWIGDININNTARLMGQQDNNQGYIVFGNGDTASLGRSGTGALTYAGNFNAAAITGSTVSAGTIGNVGALLTGTVTTNAQPYITSLGILTGLVVNGTLTATTLNGALGGPFNGTVGASVPNSAAFTSITACNNVTIYGTLTAAQFNIVGNVTGNLSGTASTATTAGTATYASTSGLASAATTVVRPYQGNITGVGSLANLTVIGISSFSNSMSVFGDISTSGNVSAAGYVTATYSLYAGNVSILGGNLQLADSYTIGNSYGRLGDYKGKIVWDSGNVYICTADYTTGTFSIWKRAGLSSF